MSTIVNTQVENGSTQSNDSDRVLADRSRVVPLSLVREYQSCHPDGGDVPPFFGIACHGCDSVTLRNSWDDDTEEVCEKWEEPPRRFDNEPSPVEVFTDPYVREGRVLGTQHTVLLPSGTCPECAELLRPFRQGRPFTPW